LLTTLGSVERLQPLSNNVYVVAPESELAEYRAAVGSALPPHNVISNGACAPAEDATSAVADLARAVEHFNLQVLHPGLRLGLPAGRFSPPVRGSRGRFSSTGFKHTKYVR
jgi:hypothetical protein